MGCIVIFFSLTLLFMLPIIIPGFALRPALAPTAARRRTAWWYAVGRGQLFDFHHACSSPDRSGNRQSEIGHVQTLANIALKTIPMSKIGHLF
jgi:hypothetical protein